MNGNRVDELAKGLATNRLSKRQVLKGVAKGLLLTGPLGALTRPASAQAVNCRSICADLFPRSGRRNNCRKVCERRTCPNCGTCKTLLIDRSTNTLIVGSASCEDSCATKTLCTKANQDADYMKLALFLWGEHYVTIGEPEAFEVYDDGVKKGSFLATRYAVEGTDKVATLLYVVEEATGARNTHAVVGENEVPQTVVIIDAEGGIEKVPIPTSSASSANLTPAVSAAHSGGSLGCSNCNMLCAGSIAIGCFVIGAVAALGGLGIGLAVGGVITLACFVLATRACPQHCNDQNYSQTREDEKNCGECGRICPDDHHCCEGGCWDKDGSEEHCGTCGNTCGSCQKCDEGICVDTGVQPDCFVEFGPAICCRSKPPPKNICCAGEKDGKKFAYCITKDDPCPPPARTLGAWDVIVMTQ